MKIYYLALAFLLMGCRKNKPQIKIRKLDIHIHHYKVNDETGDLYKYDIEEDNARESIQKS